MSNRVEKWRSDFGNFDLGRLTAIGWLWLLLSVGVPGYIGVSLIVDARPPGSPPDSRGMMKLQVVPVLLAIVGMFLGGSYLLNRLGLTAVRPPKPTPPSSPSA